VQVRRGALFIRDLRSQLLFLVRGDDAEGIERLEEDLAALDRLLGVFPDAGSELTKIDGTALRKLKLRRCPFIVWYLREKDQITFTRLFHARQDRATPSVTE